MVRDTRRHQASLESKAVAAHRAYVEALATWEYALHLATCRICRPEGLSDDEHASRCGSAETKKEHLRVAFRDLCDELGYVPAGHGIALPDKDWPCGARNNSDLARDRALERSREQIDLILKSDPNDRPGT